jgi:pilus assembly protein CpaF
MNETEMPVQAVRAQVAAAINIIIQLSRIADGSRKVTYISEGTGMDLQGNYTTNDIFIYEQTGRDKDGKIIGALNPTGNLPTFMHEIEVNHLPFPREMFKRPPGLGPPRGMSGGH